MPFQKGHLPFPGVEKGWFKKGQVPWSKSQKGVTLNSGRTHFKKGERANPAGEFKKGERTGAANPRWKGDEVGYGGLHIWVHKNKGKADRCAFEKTSGGCSEKFEWANLSHEYKRDLNDWISLCQKCHQKYDNVGHKRWEARRRNGTDKWTKK